MRYIALIALIDFLLIAAAGAYIPPGTDWGSAVLGAFFICVFAIPIAIVVGFPMLWVARKFAPGSPIALVGLGTLAGLLSPMVVSWGFPVQWPIVLLGGAMGFTSALLWWALVERYPDRRAYYD